MWISRYALRDKHGNAKIYKITFSITFRFSEASVSLKNPKCFLLHSFVQKPMTGNIEKRKTEEN